ncbi:hypothetical protein DSUL_20314 [Desulfovibrionales bacterium]
MLFLPDQTSVYKHPGSLTSKRLITDSINLSNEQLQNTSNI